MLNALFLNSCVSKIVEKENNLKAELLIRVQNECDEYWDYSPKDIDHIWEFENSEFRVSTWIEGYDDINSFGGLYLKYKEGESFFQQFTSSVNGCYLDNINFELNEKYHVTGYGILFGNGSNLGTVERRGAMLLVDEIKRIE